MSYNSVVIGRGISNQSSNWVSIAEAFPGTGCNISNTRKFQFCKQPFELLFRERLLFKIRFNTSNPVLRIASVVLCFFFLVYKLSRTVYNV